MNDYEIRLETVSSGYDRKCCWVHPRAGVIPGDPPSVVLTMQKLLLTESDVFYALNEIRSDDLAASWSGPVEHGETLGRRQEPDGVVVCACDFTPAWHASSGKLLGTGHTARYTGERLMSDPRPRETVYSVYDADGRTWAPWQTVEMPDAERFYCAGAGSTQRIDLPNGEILLPIYFRIGDCPDAIAAVMRCSFDGGELKCLEVGEELSFSGGRGFNEPSLVKHGDRFFLTLRNDERGYVTSGPDGMSFDTPKPWMWDDDTELGNYNTQQHWVSHGDDLFLVYTRRGADNDHVFRHRAPLFMALVATDDLCVVRETERILVPERGARLGNFGATNVNDEETWVTVSEWMQGPAEHWRDPEYCERNGSDNSVFAARIVWSS